jgi:hypothetical protein
MNQAMTDPPSSGTMRMRARRRLAATAAATTGVEV